MRSTAPATLAWDATWRSRSSSEPGPQTTRRLRRFDDEAHAVAALNHPNVLSVFDVGRHDGMPYLVLELLEGETLRQRLERGTLSARRAIEMAVEVCRGLEAAHAQGLVHRDLKPENLFLTTDGRVKILDFGLAKLTARRRGVGAPGRGRSWREGHEDGPRDHSGDSRVPVSGAGAGSRRGRPVGPLRPGGGPLRGGVRAASLSSGRTPADTLSAILNHDPPAVTSASGPIPPALDRVVRRCLAKDPVERFHSAHDLGLALEAVLDRPSGLGSRGAGGPQPVPRPVVLHRGRRRPLLRAGGRGRGAVESAEGADRSWR